MKSLSAGCALAAYAVLFGGTGIAWAQPVSFEGKTLRIVVGFGPGGGYDSYARLLGRHIGAHIPGKPRVIVENMPGAGSLTVVRWLDGPAPKDGTAIAAFNPGLITQSIMEPKKLRNLRFTDYAWIGNLTRDQRVCYVLASKGLKGFADFKAGKQWIIGVPAPGVASWVNFKTMQGLMGVNIKIITGFKGSADIRIAIERGELDADCGAWSSIPTDWTENKKITPVIKFSPTLPPDAPKDVAYARDIVTKESDRAVLDVVNGAAEIGRPYIASMKVPAPVVAVLRKAFDEAAKSPGLIADARKARLPLDAMSAAEVEAELKKIYGAPPDAVERAKAMLSR